jgi:signal transduction histidine kinase
MLSCDETRRTSLKTGSGKMHETTLRAKDNRRIPVLLSVSAVRDKIGGLIGLACVGGDLTERKQANEILRRQKEELSEFAHTMNHDLQNRLHNILGYAILLQKKYNPNHVERIEQLIRNTSELLRRSVTLADAGLVIEKTNNVDISQVVRETAENTIPENIAFRYDQLPAVTCDRMKISQIFQNLFENAVTHGKASKIEVKGENVDDAIRIRFVNDGMPISVEHRSKVFRHGFTTKAGRRGLGLAIVKKIVEAHGWEIMLEETPPTTFRIVIPFRDS